jgi:phospholipase D3/4
MELGVLVWECGCLARDLKRIFETYWNLSADHHHHHQRRVHVDQVNRAQTVYNMHRPLTILDRGHLTDVFLAVSIRRCYCSPSCYQSSPAPLNGDGRTCDLDAIVAVIDKAHTYIYIHVMDFIPMLVYVQPKRYWPTIDDALRRAVVERGVHVLLLTAALHYAPIALRFQQSLASINTINGSVHVVGGGVAMCAIG